MQAVSKPMLCVQVALLEQNTDRLVLIEFFAPWCASCKAMYLKLSKFCEENPNIVIGKVNFEENREIAKKLGVKVCFRSFLFHSLFLHAYIYDTSCWIPSYPVLA